MKHTLFTLALVLLALLSASCGDKKKVCLLYTSSGRGNLLSYPIRRFMFFSFIFSIFSSEILLSVMKEFTIDIEPNYKDVLGSLVVGFGICGISGLWIMLAEQLPSLQKSVEAMNAGAENIAGGNAFGTFMIAVIAAPVVEEILFRGIVLRSCLLYTSKTFFRYLVHQTRWYCRE